MHKALGFNAVYNKKVRNYKNEIEHNKTGPNSFRKL